MLSDWRVALLVRLEAEGVLAGAVPHQPAIVWRTRLRWCVARPGVPELQVRESYHWRRKSADAAAARWNRALREIAALPG